MIKVFNEKKIKIDEISKKDLKIVREYLSYINSLVKEDAQILINKRLSLKEEREWIEREIKDAKKKKHVILVAKDGNKVVGIADIKLKAGRKNHVGILGISIRKGYRGIGLGKFLMKEILKLAKRKLKPKPKIILLSVFSTNNIAINLYKKFGFKKVAKIPKQYQYKGKLVDEIVMMKYL